MEVLIFQTFCGYHTLSFCDCISIYYLLYYYIVNNSSGNSQLHKFWCWNLCSYLCSLMVSSGCCCRVNFKLKSDTDLFEIAKCKTSVSAIEVLQLYEHISELIVDDSTLCYLGGFW